MLPLWSHPDPRFSISGVTGDQLVVASCLHADPCSVFGGAAQVVRDYGFGVKATTGCRVPTAEFAGVDNRVCSTVTSAYPVSSLELGMGAPYVGYYKIGKPASSEVFHCTSDGGAANDIGRLVHNGLVCIVFGTTYGITNRKA
jgi:hypothetical protein